MKLSLKKKKVITISKAWIISKDTFTQVHHLIIHVVSMLRQGSDGMVIILWPVIGYLIAAHVVTIATRCLITRILFKKNEYHGKGYQVPCERDLVTLQ